MTGIARMHLETHAFRPTNLGKTPTALGSERKCAGLAGEFDVADLCFLVSHS